MTDATDDQDESAPDVPAHDHRPSSSEPCGLWRNPLGSGAAQQRTWGIDLGSRRADGWQPEDGPASGEGYDEAKKKPDVDGVPWELQ